MACCQANVYYSRTPSGEEFAIKIFKTSILVFKDRDRYVSGEWLQVAMTAREGVGVEDDQEVTLWWRCGVCCVNHRRVPLPPRLLPQQPPQDGEALGGEGDAEPQEVSGHVTQDHACLGHTRQACESPVHLSMRTKERCPSWAT